VLEVEWPLFGELCRALALRVARSYDPEIVVGIARAGVIPGAVIASILRRPFLSVTVSETGEAGASVLAGTADALGGRRVLLVDETCDSGDTFKVALSALRRHRPADVKTAVSFRTGDYAPDFHAMETENHIILPWDRLVVHDGELITRPDYARWLSEA
jgi:hypoxanthine phosphoribosyltransferase